MNKKYLTAGCCIALIFINTLLLVQILKTQKKLEQKISDMQIAVMDSIAANTNDLTHTMKNSLEQQSSILYQSDFSVEKQNGSIVLLAEATPKSFSNGETAFFQLLKTNGSVQTENAVLENGIWKCKMKTDLFDEGTLSIAVTKDGVTTQEELGTVSAAAFSVIDAQSQWGQSQSDLYLLVYPSDSIYDVKDIVKAEVHMENKIDNEILDLAMTPVADTNTILEDQYTEESFSSSSAMAIPIREEESSIQRLGFSINLADYLQTGKIYQFSFSIILSDGTVLSGGDGSTSYGLDKSGTLHLSGGSFSLEP